MEILKPEEQPTEAKESSNIPTEFLDAGINLKNVQFLDYLDLKDSMFNSAVMEKVDFIASKLEGLDNLSDMDMRLGNDGSMPKLEKIYLHLKLIEQAEKAKERYDIISNQIKQNEQR